MPCLCFSLTMLKEWLQLESGREVGERGGRKTERSVTDKEVGHMQQTEGV